VTVDKSEAHDPLVEQFVNEAESQRDVIRIVVHALYGNESRVYNLAIKDLETIESFLAKLNQDKEGLNPRKVIIFEPRLESVVENI
jgi:hypothetical protein